MTLKSLDVPRIIVEAGMGSRSMFAGSIDEDSFLGVPLQLITWFYISRSYDDAGIVFCCGERRR